MTVAPHPTHPRHWLIDGVLVAGAEDADAARALIAESRAAPDPGPTATDVRAEARRRILARVGARTFDDAMARELNALMRASDLHDKRLSGEALTAAEETEADALRALAADIRAIRAASNAMEVAPPDDYADDARWPTP